MIMDDLSHTHTHTPTHTPLPPTHTTQRKSLTHQRVGLPFSYYYSFNSNLIFFSNWTYLFCNFLKTFFLLRLTLRPELMLTNCTKILAWTLQVFPSQLLFYFLDFCLFSFVCFFLQEQWVPQLVEKSTNTHITLIPFFGQTLSPHPSVLHHLRWGQRGTENFESL